MKRILVLLFILQAVPVLAVDTPMTPVPTVAPLRQWNAAKVPWDVWFKKNATVTDKTDYLYIFWDAQVFKANFEGKDKKKRLAEAALELASRLYPSDSKVDLIKVDISYILDQDAYGLPLWDSIQRSAHLEFSRSKMMGKNKKFPAVTDEVLKKNFDKFEIF